MTRSVTVRVPTATRTDDALLLCPSGMATSLGGVEETSVDGGSIRSLTNERSTGQPAMLIAPTGDELAIQYTFSEATETPLIPRYPESAFDHRPHPLTEAAAELATVSAELAREAGGGKAAIRALIAEAAARFTYDHPDERFNDGHTEVPYLGCSIAAGSCVDINTYLMASLRAAGLEAAYAFGHFFPAERGGYTVDSHCWVATRVDGVIEEWDIAHHKKMGTDDIRPGLNPKPGCRVALGHSLGHSYATPYGNISLKLLAQPHWVSRDGSASHANIKGAWLA